MVATPIFTTETPLQNYEWINTNRLLPGAADYQEDDQVVEPLKGTLGCKTGITQSAGPCFAGFFDRKSLGKGNQGRDRVIVVVLNSKTMEQRWVEVPQLVRWF